MSQELFVNILLSILGFIGILSVQQLMKIAKAINEIKTDFSVMSTKHDYLEDRVKNMETIVQTMKTKTSL